MQIKEGETTAADDRRVLADSVTQIATVGRDRIVLCGSHGGRYSAHCALAAGVAAIVFNDAAVGLDQAGIDGLNVLEEHGIPAATVDRKSAVIGSATETAAGRISFVNPTARSLGVEPGMSAAEFAEAVEAASAGATPEPALSEMQESRQLILDGPLRVWALDSVSLATREHDATIVVTGSHAQLLGGHPESALNAAARLAVFNDAGGVVAPSRLDVLDERETAAVAVAAASARIGEASSTYHEGVISAADSTAMADGASVGMRVVDYIAQVVGRAAEAGVS
ncbi:MAG: hypothetical protein J0H06_08925 [Actinobacteria bacterium]|nr:hypothetical protein [Actinomycetota bacterium]